MDDRRRTRVEREILREISSILRNETRDPRLRIVTVTRVGLSRDGSHAVVSYSNLGNDDTEVEAAAEALESASGFIRCLLAERMSLRLTPELRFMEDDSIVGGERVLGMMRAIENDRD